jgi:DUF3040 family protein
MVRLCVSRRSRRVAKVSSDTPLVKVDAMLDPHEKIIFDEMVTFLRGDPRFQRRIGRLSRPHRRRNTVLAILLWTLAPVCIVFGGWTGILMAAVGTAYGVYLITHRDRRAGRGRYWSSHRPGASSGL